MDWTMALPEDYVLAPDGSEVRPLVTLRQASMAHCTLPPGAVSKAIRHRTIEELWYVIAGTGQVWRKAGELEDVVEVGAGCSLAIPTGAHFQFRNTGASPFVFVLATMPPWPGEEEAVRVADFWPTGSE